MIPLGAAHSSTSISSALGFAVANKMTDKPGKAIAVIGDGAMSAGMAYEAMNNAEAAGNRLVVILNDNDMSIAPPVGGLFGLSRAAGIVERISGLAQICQQTHRTGFRAVSMMLPRRQRNMRAAWRWAVRYSRNLVSIMSARLMGIISISLFRFWKMCVTMPRGRC